MINKEENLSFITDENGVDHPIQVIREFDSIDNKKRFVIYTDIEDKPLEEKEFMVAQLVEMEDGSIELADIESEDDMEYCQEAFDEIIDEMMSEVLDEEMDEEEDKAVA